MIILQLKSTQEQAALDNISSIIKTIDQESGYQIRGHEIHQVSSVMRNMPLVERAKTVAQFCNQNGIKYITYHAPILGPGDNIWARRDRVAESMHATVQEAQAVYKEAGLKGNAVVVFHLTSYVAQGQIPATFQEKMRLIEAAEQEFATLFSELDARLCTFAVENTYPRAKGSSATIGPFHPLEVAKLARRGVATTLDFAHYHLYSNYVKHGTGSSAGDIDRQAYGMPPDWQECVRILRDSLVQLHISDARGMGIEGEGLPLGQGDIPLAEVLTMINSAGRDIRGTLELAGGHLNGGRLQLEGARWLLENIHEIF